VTELVLAFTLFILLHSVPALPAIRARLIAAIGHRAYICTYSLVSITILVWLFKAAIGVEYIELWEPAAWQVYVTLIAAPLGMFLVLAGLLSGNPYSISFRSGETTPGAIVSVTRHPVLWGFLLWALGHLAPNGDLRSVILFGGFAMFSIGGFVMLEKRARRKFGMDWRAVTATTSIIPFAASIHGVTRIRLDRPLLLAAILATIIVGWLLLAGGHAGLVGVDPLLMAVS
jgi:uncharacterized membrane protein